MYVFDRLSPRYPHEVVPGVTGMSGAWTRAGVPMTHGDDVLTILPGTLDLANLSARLRNADAAVIMKVGRNLAKNPRRTGRSRPRRPRNLCRARHHARRAHPPTDRT